MTRSIATDLDVTLTNTPRKFSKRVLDPHERISEVLFGLIMVLTFTGSISVAESGRENIRAMLIGVLGCNLAWGIIDAVLYLLGCLAEQGRNLKTLRAVRKSSDAAHAHRFISSVMPPLMASVLQSSELETIRQRLLQLPEPSDPARLNSKDFLGAAGVFLLVFLSTFPVALPFILVQSPRPALRISNSIAIAMLFLAGVAYGRSIGRSSWIVGIVMVVLGMILVGVTIALGG
jgi:hypothetical protein